MDSVFTPTGRDLGNSTISTLWQRLSTHSAADLGAIHKIGAPIHVYQLYENAFRAHRGQSLKANNEESAKLYAEFSKIASTQEYAWSHGTSQDEKAIGTVSGKNRMICFPYPLLMNAFNTVNLAGAVILTPPPSQDNLTYPNRAGYTHSAALAPLTPLSSGSGPTSTPPRPSSARCPPHSQSPTRQYPS